MEQFDSRVHASAHRDFEEWRRKHPGGFVLNHRLDLARQSKWYPRMRPTGRGGSALRAAAGAPGGQAVEASICAGSSMIACS
jgi:hypothetical protein